MNRSQKPTGTQNLQGLWATWLKTLMTMTHMNWQIPSPSLWQNSSISHAGWEVWVFVCCFMTLQSNLSLCSVPFSSAYPCLRVWYAGSLEKSSPNRRSLCVGVYTDVSGLLVWLSGLCIFISHMAYVCPWGVRWSSPSLVERGLRKRKEIAVLEGFERGKCNRMMRPLA